jgi:hypothetical protein
LPSLQVLVPKGLIFLLTNFIHSACNTCSPFPELVSTVPIVPEFSVTLDLTPPVSVY